MMDRKKGDREDILYYTDYCAASGRTSIQGTLGYLGYAKMKVSNAEYCTIYATGGNDIITLGAGTTNNFVYAGAGNDFIGTSINTKNPKIYGGSGNDTIRLTVSNAYAEGESGNDLFIPLNNIKSGTLKGGSGNDTFWFIESTDNLVISGGTGINIYDFDPYYIGGPYHNTMTITDLKNDDIIRYNYGSSNGDELTYYKDSSGNIVLKDMDYGNFTITLKGVTDISQVAGVTYEGVDATRTLGEIFSIDNEEDDEGNEDEEGNDTIEPEPNIQSSSYNISNSNNATILSGSSYADTIYNVGSYVKIAGDSGNDSLVSAGNKNTVLGGAGNDYIYVTAWLNSSGSAFATSSAYNYIDGGDGNDIIYGCGGGTKTTLIGGNGNDYISSASRYASILGGSGSDTIFNGYLYDSDGSYSTIIGGEGADSIANYTSNVTIVGGAGNDTVTLGSNALYNVFNYASGDGNDVIYGFDSNDTINITSGTYSTQVSGSDTIIKTTNGQITLKNYTGTVSINGNKTDENKGKNISNSTANTVLNGSNYNDTISNNANYTKIYAGLGNDSIYNSTGSNITISGGDGADTINNSFAESISIDSGSGDDSIYGNNNYATIIGGTGKDTIIGNHWRSKINSGADNDLVSLTTYWYDTIDGGDGNDTIIAGGGEHSVNGGAGNDRISLSGDYLTVKGGTGNDTIYGDSSKSHLYQYNKGDGNDIIYGANENDTITIVGASYSTVSSGNNILVNITNSGTITLSSAKGKIIKVYSDQSPDTDNPKPQSSVTPQEVIKKFMGALDTITSSGISALDQAISIATNGYFSNIQTAINQMLADCSNANSADDFLLNKCGINLNNTDTGAITGSDAGGSTILTATSIVPENGNLDTSFNSNYFTTNNGLTFYLSKSNLSSDEL